MNFDGLKIGVAIASIIIPFENGGKAAANELAGMEPGRVQAAAGTNDPVTSALTQARSIGTLSFLASVIENARLTPERSDHIASVARTLRPDLGPAINKAVMLSASLEEPRQRLGLTTASDAQPLPYPAANLDLPFEGLSEYQANYSLSAMHADAALAQGYTGKGVTVGVIDTGIDIRPDGTMHPEFQGRIDPRSTSMIYYFDPEAFSDWENVTQEEFNQAFQQPSNASMDQEGHGTHVSGLIGAGNNGFGMQGVAPGANLFAVKVAGMPQAYLRLTNGTEMSSEQAAICGPSAWYQSCNSKFDYDNLDSFAAGGLYLAQFPDVKVINGSFSYVPSPEEKLTWDLTDPETQAQFSTIAQVRLQNINAGQIFVQSAGNGRLSNPVMGENPTIDGLLPFIRPAHETATNSSGALIYNDGGAGLDYSFLSPEALDAREKAEGRALGRYIVVVATDAYNNLSSYSQKCGVAKMWCIAAPGGDGNNPEQPQRGIVSTIPEDTYGIANGTSMAAPNVSGALAVLIEAFPTFTPRQIVALLFRTAEDLGAPGVDDVYGWGLARLDRALAGGPAGLAGTGTYIAGNNNADNVWVVDFKSEGGLEKQGSGTLVIAEDIAFAKSTTIREGDFVVDGIFTTPDLEVMQKGTLLGGGAINGDVSVAGTLSPGSGIGTLKVNGNLELQDTAVTEIAFADGHKHAYDAILLPKAGTVFTAGGVLAPNLDAQEQALTLGTPYAFVSTPNGSVAGSFLSLRQPEKGLQPGTRLDALYFHDALALTPTPASYANLSLLGVEQSANDRAFGSAIDTIRPAAGQRPGKALEGLFSTLYAANADNLETDFSTLPAEIHATTGAVALRSMDRFSDMLFTRQTELASGQADPRREIISLGEGSLWVEGEYNGASIGTKGGIGGFDVTATTTAFGIDWMTPYGLAGIAAAQDLSKVDAANSSGQVSTYQLGAYGLLEAALVDVALSGGLAYGDISSSRKTDLGAYAATATASGNGIGGFVEGALLRTFDLDGSLLTPSFQVGYHAFDRHSMSEKGGVFATGVPDQFYQNTQTTLAVTVSKVFERDGGVVFKPAIGIGWKHDFGDIEAGTMLNFYGAAYQAQTAPVGRDAFVGELSFSVIEQQRFSFSVNYELELRENFSSNTFSAKAALRF